MHTRSKLILAALTASLLMGLAVSSATAGRLSVTNTRFRVTWASLRFFSGGFELRCPVTLEGSFHSATIRKTRGALIGAVTAALVPNTEPPCTNGVARTLNLPWHVTFENFRGTLPNISAIELLLARYAFLIRQLGVGCLYDDHGRAEENQMGQLAVGAGGQITTLTPSEDRRAALRTRLEGIINCPAFGQFEGPGQVFLQGSSTTRISVRLI